jgi:hypothetical protein
MWIHTEKDKGAEAINSFKQAKDGSWSVITADGEGDAAGISVDELARKGIPIGSPWRVLDPDGNEVEKTSPEWFAKSDRDPNRIEAMCVLATMYFQQRVYEERKEFIALR